MSVLNLTVSAVAAPYTVIASNLTTDNFFVDGLVSGMTYFFTVTPYNTIGAGLRSLPSLPVVALGTPPAVVGVVLDDTIGIVVAPATDTTAAVMSYSRDLVWDTIINYEIDNYTITYSLDATPMAPITIPARTENYYTFNGLTLGSTIIVQITAHNKIGAGDASTSLSRVVTVAPGKMLKPVLTDSVVGVTQSSVTVNWQPVAFAGGMYISRQTNDYNYDYNYDYDQDYGRQP